MASTNNDQVNVLLPSDEESPSPPPPAGRPPIKALLAAGLCLTAAGLAGAAVMGRQATHAPPQIKRPWAGTISLAKETRLNFISEECYNLLAAQAKEVKESGRKDRALQGALPDCMDSEKTCRWKWTTSEFGEMSSSQCFPASCKQENILKTLQANAKNRPPGPNGEVLTISDVDVTCAKNGEELPEEKEKWQEYLSQECHDSLEALEKEAISRGGNMKQSWINTCWRRASLQGRPI